MNKVQEFILKASRKLYSKFLIKQPEVDCGVTDPNEASNLIYDLLASGKPCMIARYGSVELLAIVNYLNVIKINHSVINYIRGKEFQWWWNRLSIKQMQTNAGFFPATEENVAKFSKLMIEDSKQVDILGSWLQEEEFIKSTFNLKFTKVTLLSLEPYWAKSPWSRILEGKKVLVIHPFASLIEEQYSKKRDSLFKNKDVLPLFELRTIQAVQSIGGECQFKDWFEALDSMKQQMDAIDYDIALMGCGAYGFPLAAHAKRMGKQAVHLGGALQLLFGIRGKRWEDPNYGVKEWGLPRAFYLNIMNESWVRPGECGRPKNANQVEGGCYW